MGPVEGPGDMEEIEAHAGAHEEHRDQEPKPIASSLPWNSSWESPARSARNKLKFSHSVGNVAGHRRLENDPAVMREQAGNCIKGSSPQTAFERSHLALVQSEGQFRAA